MNSTDSKNQTCSNSDSIGIALFSLNFNIFLPFQIWVLCLGTRNFINAGRLKASEIFIMNLSALELLATITCDLTLAAFAISNKKMILIVIFFSGSYLVGRPVMNSLICVERFVAVAHPLIYRNPAFVKHRYIACGLVWMLIVAYGGFAIYIYPESRNEVYISFISVSILVIAACSLLVLKILLRPSPGETQKEGMDRQKKKAFVIITVILFWISVPYSLDMLLLSIRNNVNDDLLCVLQKINLWLLQQGSVINPLLYLSQHGHFSCIKKLFKAAENVKAASSDSKAF